MKIASILTGTQVRAAVALDSGHVFVPSLLPGDLVRERALPDSVRGILAETGGLDALRAVVKRANVEGYASGRVPAAAVAIIPEQDAVFAAPVSNPIHFVGCGASYHQHLAEMGGVPVPEHPVIFLCSPISLTGHKQVIQVPPHQATMIDYEGELAAVIGRSCYRVSENDALEYVVGYVIHNDVSARDHVAEVQAVTVPIKMIDAWGRNVAAKQHPTFSPMGPYLVTSDEIRDPHALHLTTRVNGKVTQNVGTNDLIFTVAQYVSYISQWYTLQPGDIISTGTPGGVGIAKKPPVFLRPDDVVEVSITGLGTLSNTIGHLK
jgi:2-keto-4-pentenoate hydratase/2-oxohepta-3-ene-1,7-dioic acid hydratase in catechol pathway